MSSIAQPLNLNASTLETIKQRQVILLDTSVWIRLADGRTSKANELRERLTALVSKEIVFCPLCAPTILELRKQKSPSLLRTAELMEQLSLNVSFRGLD
jgi:predicted nucleic acid-binding protein